MAKFNYLHIRLLSEEEIMSRPKGQGELTKKKISDHAQKIFEKKGYNSTSIADIQNSTGLSKGTIYHHFKNKEDLYLHCIEEASKLMLTKLKNNANDAGTIKNTLFSLSEIYAQDTQSALTNTLSEFLLTHNNDQFKTNIVNLIEPEIKLIESIIKRGVNKNELRKDLDISETSFILYSILTTLGSVNILGYKKDINHLYEQTMILFLAGIEKK